ncbi:MAG: helix-turn-helix transcriptional regulator [Formosimonas sp.]
MQKKTNCELLATFNAAGDDARVRVPTVQAVYGGISRATVWRNVKLGHIPAPSKLTPNTSTWRVGDLRQALAKGGA